MTRTFLLSAFGVFVMVIINSAAQSREATPVATISQIQRAMVSPSSNQTQSLVSEARNQKRRRTGRHLKTLR